MKLRDNYKYFISIFLCFISIFIFEIWKIYPLYSDKLFSDWEYIYNYYSCLNNLEIKEFTCAYYLRNDFIYPKIWLSILERAYPVFEIIIYPFIILYFLLTFKFFNNFLKIYHFLFLFSPTSILLVQRGNNELVIFLLIFIFMIFLNQKKFKIMSIFPYLLTILLKIFPISLLVIYFLQDIKKINHLKIISLTASLIVLYFLFSQFLDIKKNFDLNNGKITLVYGADSIFYLVTLIIGKLNFNYQYLSIAALIILTILSFKFKIKKLEKINSYNETSFLIGSTILVSSFFLNTSFEYRFIYIIFTLPFLFDLKEISQKKIIFYFILLIYLVLWFEFFIFYFKEMIDFQKDNILIESILNFKVALLGFFIVLKNLIYWVINFGLILLSKDIIFNKLNKI